MSHLNSERPKRSWIGTLLLTVFFIVVLGLIGFVILKENENPEVEYYKNLMSAEQHEYLSPGAFLKSEGTYRKTLFGRKYRIEGNITNTASSAVYKDVVLEVLFYSRTKTRIGSIYITLYDVFPPKVIKAFDKKVPAPEGTEEIGWGVVDAARN